MVCGVMFECVGDYFWIYKSENETKMVGDSIHFVHDGVHFFVAGDECEQENFANLREAIDFLTKL